MSHIADHSRNLREVTNHGFTKPDECPPRQTESVPDEKNGKKRPCPRKCSTDSDCLNDRKLCLCDGACGMSCIRPEKECPELPDPPHGQVQYSLFLALSTTFVKIWYFVKKFMILFVLHVPWVFYLVFYLAQS